jgi:DNA-binding transcriptional MocR family regulator
MAESLQRELGEAIEFNRPQGGMFFWARLSGSGGRSPDATAFAQRAVERLVAFVPGKPFFAHDPDTASLRLSFATVDEAKILEGVKRLGQAL